MHIGPHRLSNRLFVAPMAGVTDRPFRRICRQLGAGMAVSEMVASDPRMRLTYKSRRRMDHRGEAAPISVQIAGADPRQMADAAKYNVGQGAQIIDINMGCPAKKVCNVAAGSALLKDEDLVRRILDTVVRAVDVPVTLKIRTGWDTEHRNAVRIAEIAQSAGIRALAVHGRTRACGFTGAAEYATIAAIKAQVSIPVIANGDIDTPEKARRVLEETHADAIMIGRAAQGRPWIFRDIDHYLVTGDKLPPPSLTELCQLLVDHLCELHELYADAGVGIARKHIFWYTRELTDSAAFRQDVNRLETAAAQVAAVERFFVRLGERDDGSLRERELAA